ncbi:hypothetical protein M0R45_014721 [Rubus argutus]|uniref:Uncharacterized protein n=1 Tax=Rubus argutus TaxID=59490 RepID=A0AAW1XM95_RUBAR
MQFLISLFNSPAIQSIQQFQITDSSPASPDRPCVFRIANSFNSIHHYKHNNKPAISQAQFTHRKKHSAELPPLYPAISAAQRHLLYYLPPPRETNVAPPKPSPARNCSRHPSPSPCSTRLDSIFHWKL